MLRLTLIIYFIHIVSGKINKHFVTEECGHVLGPEHGAFLEFDRTVKQKDGVINIPIHLKGTLFECTIVIQGMPATKGETRNTAMHWRTFHVQDQNVDTIQTTPIDCKKAYVTVYRGMDRTAPEIGTFCGKDILNQNVEFEGRILTLYFYIDYRNPDWVTTPVPPVVNDAGNSADDVTESGIVENTTPLDTFPYPLVYIKLDVTSFDYACNGSVRGEVMKCNDSQRCIHDDLRCDYYYSRNCISSLFPRDKSDSGRHPPALCWVIPTTTTEPTTTEPPPPVPFQWEPIVGVASALTAILAFLFCCLKPGYIPWRCARLRNVPCLTACGTSCSPCCLRCLPPCCLNICPCCSSSGYGPGPTGGAAAARMREIGQLNSSDKDYPDSVFHGSVTNGTPMDNGPLGPPGYPNGGPFTGQPPKKSLKQKLFPCLKKTSPQSGWPGRKIGSVAPSERPDQLQDLSKPGSKWRAAAFNKPQGPGNTESLPNGTPTFQGKSPFDERDDPEGLGIDWLKFLSNDGGHLREQR